MSLSHSQLENSQLRIFIRISRACVVYIRDILVMRLHLLCNLSLYKYWNVADVHYSVVFSSGGALVTHQLARCPPTIPIEVHGYTITNWLQPEQILLIWLSL